MSAQELDVKRSWRAIRRHRRAIGVVALMGLLGGGTFALLNPPMHAAQSLVVLPAPPADADEGNTGTHTIETQVLVAESGPVLTSAGQNLDPPLPTNVVRERVEVTAVTRDVIEIEAQGTSADQAIRLANAVAEVYLVFVTTEQNLPEDVGGRRGARVLEQATDADGGSMAAHLAIFGLAGASAGAILGAIAILAISRGDRRLRLRAEIADAVGMPVLASVSSYRASNVADWANLLERYKPSAVDSWSLRQTLHRLGLDQKDGNPRSLAVISFAEDDKALTLGPQLAAFATSVGIDTSLLVDTRSETSTGDAEATTAAFLEGTLPRLVTNGQSSSDSRETFGLRISLVVVDRDNPQLAGTMRTTKSVIGLSAGAVTAEELARLAVAAATGDRTIDGLIVADPDPSDRTTGRVPQSMWRSSSKLPTLLTGAVRKAAR